MSKFYGTAAELDAAILGGDSELLAKQTIPRGPYSRRDFAFISAAEPLAPPVALVPIRVTCPDCGVSMRAAMAWTLAACGGCHALIRITAEASSHV